MSKKVDQMSTDNKNLINTEMTAKMDKQKEEMRSQIKDEVDKEVANKLQGLMGDYK